MSGPTVMGIRGPVRCANAPIHGENQSTMMIVMGSVASPPAAQSSAGLCCSCRTNRKRSTDRVITARVVEVGAGEFAGTKSGWRGKNGD